MTNVDQEFAVRQHRDKMRKESHAEALSIFTLAGLVPRRMWELANGYWPDAPTYDNIRRPWWLVETAIGLIRIGWRKRVLEVDWEATGIEGTVTSDDTTKAATYVHAWTPEKAIEYLRRLREVAAEKDVQP